MARHVVLETLRPPRGRALQLEPFTPEWFEHLDQKRYGRHGWWLPKLLEFRKHPGEKVLGIGSGLGCDWCRYAAEGADVRVCHPDPEHLDRVRRNFEWRGLTAQFHRGDWDALPIESEQIDVAALVTPWEPGVSLETLVAETYRVLKPGGKVLAVLPAHYDVHWWLNVLLPWHRWTKPAHPALRPDERYSSREVRRLFGRFSVSRVSRRQLRRSELPHLWRCLPLPVLERLIGRFVIFKGFKPVSAALEMPLAA